MRDFGMPSTHSLNALSIPLFIVYFYWNDIQNIGSWAPYAAIFAVAYWAWWISFSRMYLGVHSPADVVVGLSLGVFIFVSWTKIREPLHEWIQTSDNGSKIKKNQENIDSNCSYK
jgi:membrane-associated phospholipid phosphatase